MESAEESGRRGGTVMRWLDKVPTDKASTSNSVFPGAEPFSANTQLHFGKTQA